MMFPTLPFDSPEEVISIPGKKEYDAAITAVKNGVADDAQEKLAAKMAKNAGSSATGSSGQAARDAFKGK